jgi:hypothetical protein
MDDCQQNSNPFLFLFHCRKNRQDSLRSLLSNGSTSATAPTTGGPSSSVTSSASGTINAAQLNSSQCFSILFRGDWTLDLMILDSKRDEVLDALDLILKTYQQQKQRVSNDVLLLRYHWLDAVSEKVRRLQTVVCTIGSFSFFLSPSNAHTLHSSRDSTQLNSTQLKSPTKGFATY